MAKNKDFFGFNKAINWNKLKDPKVLKELEKIFEEKKTNKRASKPTSERASRRDNMKKYRLICHVNHIRYKDVNAKNEEQAQEMLEDIQDYDNWEYGKEYGESYVEEIKKQASEQKG